MGRGTLREDKDVSIYPRRGPGRVGGPSSRSGTGQGTIGRSGTGRGPSRRYGMGQGTLGEVQNGSGDPAKGP